MHPLEQFANRLTSERKRLNLTQAQFAQACGVKSASQFLYEKAERTPNAEYLFKAKAIGVSLTFLFGESSNSETSIPIPEDRLRQLYKQTDDMCRDQYGRLLDLEHRSDAFIDLVKQ